MRTTWLALGLAIAVFGLIASGCAAKQCRERYATMPRDQVVRSDGELLQGLVDKRRQTAEALQALPEGSSRRGETEFSIQAWEMAIRLIAQLQNISRDEEAADELAAQRELITNIRCMAKIWIDDDDHLVGSRDGQRMLGYQRDLEAAFGDRGRPTDSQLSAIIEGREIFMGPVEEEVDVPQEEEGTGPGAEPPAEGGEEGTGASGSAVDDLLGEGEEEEE
jgi:hypothetical protein